MWVLRTKKNVLFISLTNNNSSTIDNIIFLLMKRKDINIYFEQYAYNEYIGIGTGYARNLHSVRGIMKAFV